MMTCTNFWKVYLFTVSVGCHGIGMIKKGALRSNVIYAKSGTINYVKILCKTSSMIKHPHFIVIFVSRLTLSSIIITFLLLI